jgi:hypothetical protein
MVESWLSVIGSQFHLSHWFIGPDGKRDDEYGKGVKRRFVQWALMRRYDLMTRTG